MLKRNGELLKGAEAALPGVTRGKLDKCSIQAVSGRTGHALWQIAPSSSLPAPPLPQDPTLGGSTWDPPRGGLLVVVTQPCLSAPTCRLPSRKSGKHFLSLLGQQDTMGFSRGWFLRPWFQTAPPPAPLGLATSATPLAQPLDGGWEDVTSLTSASLGWHPGCCFLPHPSASSNSPTPAPWPPSCLQNHYPRPNHANLSSLPTWGIHPSGLTQGCGAVLALPHLGPKWSLSGGRGQQDWRSLWVSSHH